MTRGPETTRAPERLNSKRITKSMAKIAVAAAAIGGVGHMINQEAKSDKYEQWHVTGNMPEGLNAGDEVTYLPGEHGGVLNPIVRTGENGETHLVAFDATQDGEDNSGEKYLTDVESEEPYSLDDLQTAVIPEDVEVLRVSDQRFNHVSLLGVDAIADNRPIDLGLPVAPEAAPVAPVSSGS